MHVGFVVLGAAGYMGESGLEAIAQLQKDGLDIGLVGALEANERTQYYAREAMIAAGIRQGHRAPIRLAAPGLGSLAEIAVGYKNAFPPGAPIIIYDATPTWDHKDNLDYFMGREEGDGLFYLGEKPIFTDPADVEAFSDAWPNRQIFCDFIELVNPVFLTAKEYIRKNRLRIDRLWFWRAGSVGIERLLGGGRRGVQGGSLLDKSVHDLALTIGFLGHNRVRCQVVKDAAVRGLMLHSAQAMEQPEPRLLALDSVQEGYATERDIAKVLRPSLLEARRKLPADALFELEVDWYVNGADEPIPAHYLSSWVGTGRTSGLEHLLRGRLADLGFENSVWLDATPGKPLGTRYRYTREDVRVAILECSPSGEPGGERRRVTIVCNFLTGKADKHDPPDKKDRPQRKVWVFESYGDGPAQLCFEQGGPGDYLAEKRSDLSEVFRNVVAHCAQEGDAVMSRNCTLRVHKVLLEAQNRAMRSLLTPEGTMESMIRQSVALLRSRYTVDKG